MAGGMQGEGSTKVNQANMKVLQDNYRPAGHDSQGFQDDKWRTFDSEIHIRVDSYRPERDPHKQGPSDDTFRPGHCSTHRDIDSYRFDNQPQADTYRPNYHLTPFTISNTSPSFSLGSGMVPKSRADSEMAPPSKPGPPPPSSVAAEMDVDMDILLLTAGNLAINRKESPRSIVALTRELIVRGLPLDLANLYASEKVPMIPVHKQVPMRGGLSTYCHKAQCKKCGKLQPRDFSNKKARRIKSHICGEESAETFGALLESKGWHQAFKDLDAKWWKLGPGPHDEKDSLQFLGQELLDAALVAGREGKDLVTNFTHPDPPRIPKDKPAKPKGKAAKSSSNDNNAPNRKTRGEKKTAKRILAQAQQKPSKPNTEVVAQAQAHVRAVILAQLAKQTEPAYPAATAMKATVQRRIAPQQQALPTFSVDDLEKQIDSLRLARVQQQASDGPAK